MSSEIQDVLKTPAFYSGVPSQPENISLLKCNLHTTDNMFHLTCSPRQTKSPETNFAACQGLTVAQARSMQEYYDNIDKKDPRSAVAIPKVDDQEISRRE